MQLEDLKTAAEVRQRYYEVRQRIHAQWYKKEEQQKPVAIEQAPVPPTLPALVAEPVPTIAPTAIVWMPSTLRRVMRAMRAFYGDKYVSVELLAGPARTQPIIWRRHEAMWLLRMSTSLSYPQIGRMFGGRDHTTVLSGVRRTETRRSLHPEVRERLDMLLEEVRQ